MQLTCNNNQEPPGRYNITRAMQKTFYKSLHFAINEATIHQKGTPLLINRKRAVDLTFSRGLGG
jgi:hypothetical protein